MSGDQDDLDLEEQADAVADFVEELLGVMDIDAIAEPAIEGDRFYVDILEGPRPDGRSRAQDRARRGGRHRRRRERLAWRGAEPLRGYQSRRLTKAAPS